MEDRHSLLFEYLDFKREPDENGTIVIRSVLKEKHLLDEKNIGAGVFQILLDTAIGTAVSEKARCFAVTLQLHTNIFDSAKKDILFCRAKVLHSTAKSAYGEGKILDASGRMIANGQASFKLISYKNV